MGTSGTHQLTINSTAYQSVGTLPSGNPTSSKGLYYIPARHSWDDSWELAADLLVEVNTSREEVLAVTYLAVQEYGIGDSFESAITDLLTSLSDYYQSLESREAKLAPSSVEDLEALKRLLWFPSDGARGR